MTCPNGSSPGAWKPTRSSASCCCSGTCWPGHCSRSTTSDFPLLNRILDAYEPAANRIANTVAVSFVEERERVIRQQQDALRELSTPVLQVRERLLILPIIGILDTQRARQLTEQLLRGIRTHRAKVVVVDITGVPEIDESVANHLVRTVDASRLMGARVIVTGLSAEIAQTLVEIGVDLSKIVTVGDLQGGIEEAERVLGFTVIRPDDAATINGPPTHPALVSILRQGGYLIASIHTALDDSQLMRFQHDLIDRVGRDRARGIIIDVAALDVARLLRHPHPAEHRPDGEPPRRPHGDRRDQPRRRLRHGRTGHRPQHRAHRARPGRRT